MPRKTKQMLLDHYRKETRRLRVENRVLLVTAEALYNLHEKNPHLYDDDHNGELGRLMFRLDAVLTKARKRGKP